MSSGTALDRQEMLAWLRARCTAQQVPLILRDAAVVDQVAVLLGSPEPHPGRGRGSVTPDRIDSCHLEAGRVTRRGNHDLVQYGAEDGLPAIQTQALPRVA